MKESLERREICLGLLNNFELRIIQCKIFITIIYVHMYVLSLPYVHVLL